MQILLDFGLLLLGYLMGSIPFGLIIVKLGTGKDVRKVESGRTGGTNAYRAAGIWAGVLTGLLDGIKGSVAVWLAVWRLPLGMAELRSGWSVPVWVRSSGP